MATGLLPLIAGKIRSMVDEPIPTVNVGDVQPQPMAPQLTAGYNTEAQQRADGNPEMYSSTGLPPQVMYPQSPSSEETGVGLFDSGRQQIQWRPESYDYSRLKTGGAPSGLQGFLNDPENMANLALAFNSMRLSPDQGLAQVLGQRIKYAQEQRKENAAKNATIDALRQMGLEEGELKLLGNNPELLKVAATAMYKKRYGGDITAEMQTWNALTKGLSDADQEKARRIKLGLDPRAGLALSEYFGRGYMTKSGENLSAAEAKALETKALNQSLRSQTTWALDELGRSLGATGQTGVILGNMPAMVTSSQIADNSRAILLPIMKSIWRGAGEGVFTDKDQEALEAMFPSRNMTVEAQRQALANIKRITELKLQDPKFDIQAYGNALKNRPDMQTAPVASPQANQPAASTPAPQTPASVRSQADAIIQGNQ